MSRRSTGTFYARRGKRLLDLALAIPLVVISAPVGLVVAGVVRVKLGSPVLFRQPRPGFRERSFTLTKFRTMTDERDASGVLLPDAERLDGFGALLRSTSLDELPELWHVLTGTMSLVGPRPLRDHYLERYSEEQARRHDVRPGITGWAQVNGRNSANWPERLAMDVWYVDNMSAALDLRILFATIVTVLRRQGVSAHGHATVSEFLGETSTGSGSRGATPRIAASGVPSTDENPEPYQVTVNGYASRVLRP